VPDPFTGSTTRAVPWTSGPPLLPNRRDGWVSRTRPSSADVCGRKANARNFPGMHAKYVCILHQIRGIGG
jgi:hypothetical protein